MKKISLLALSVLAFFCLWLLWPQPVAVTPAAKLKPVAIAPVAPASVAAPAKPTASVATNATATATNRFAYRLSNTTKTIGDLTPSAHAILLENALIDTSLKLDLAIPAHLRAKGDPGAYIVQARGVITPAFRAELAAVGAQIVSYIPNNAFLVRLTSASATALARRAPVQAVLPYDPYFKVQSTILGLAVKQKPLPTGTCLTLGLFGQDAAATEAQILQAGAQIVDRERSPFGPIVRVQPPSNWLALAQLPGVQIVEPVYRRISANDLSRSTMGVSPTSVSLPANDYLGLTGAGVMVQVNDTGIDASHPDLIGRVGWDFPASTNDTAGHGTHVAGIIAGDGTESTTVKFAQGSTNPAVAKQFRGMAPGANLYAVSMDASDQYLQESAALTNCLISNNSWDYGDANYNLASASYDAAVRDALSGVTGPQPVLFVFAAGNDGQLNNGSFGQGGNNDGVGGTSDTILSPATGKNVLTVGALEQFRGITNTYIPLNSSNPVAPWYTGTDSGSQVAGYSSRGNVGIGFEGTYGRFKPDVVAPGSFVVSARSTMWDTNTYYNTTNTHTHTEPPGQLVDTNFFSTYTLRIPPNTIGISLQVSSNGLSPTPFPQLKIAVSTTNLYGLDPNDPTTYPSPLGYGTNSNSVNFPADSATVFAGAIASGHLYVAVADTLKIPVDYTFTETIKTTNDDGTYNQSLTDLNNQLGPWYRYESGTSMACAEASGVLALMQQYLTNQLSVTPSPTLLKALMINGARTAWPGIYHYSLNGEINLQGWGLISISNSIPKNLNPAATYTPLYFADQSTANALATGESQTYTVTVPTASRGVPLRLTLAWTDPPGNPAASIKLVNDLDLVVSNTTSGQALVYYANDFSPSDPPYTVPRTTNSAPTYDLVNNVKSIIIPPSLGSTYTVTVYGHAVNVNAVTTQSTKIAQDYALVISCADGGNPNGITVTAGAVSQPAYAPQITYVTGTNSIIFNQFSGANAPLLSANYTGFGTNSIYGTNAHLSIGQTNQWHFFVVTNMTGYTNAAFITFIPNTAAIPRMGVFAGATANLTDQQNATRPEADLDIFVASGVTGSNLLNLDPVVISNCVSGVPGYDSATGRGGTEFVAYTNSLLGQVYYVGVKCEDQMAGQYAFIGATSLNPFSLQDTNGNVYVNGFNAPVDIPDGDNRLPGVGYVLGLALQPITVKNVIVTNTVSHQNFGDLLGFLDHDEEFATLNNHNALGPVTNLNMIYSDGATNGLTNAAIYSKSDGPGTLTNFMRGQSIGLWLLTEIDDSLTMTGRVDNLQIKLEKHTPTNTVNRFTLHPGQWFYDYIDVPLGCTNLTIVGIDETNATAVANSNIVMAVKYGADPTLADYDAKVLLDQHYFSGKFMSNTIVFGPTVQVGTWDVGFYNPDTVDHTIQYYYQLFFLGDQQVNYVSANPVPILDDAVTTSTIHVPDNTVIQSLKVGLRVDHPRISDLVFHLVSPDGTRYLLMENRGGADTNGCGTTFITNYSYSATANGTAKPDTNMFDTGSISGSLVVTYNFYTAPDEMQIYYGTNLMPIAQIYDTGVTNNPSLGAGAQNTQPISFTLDYGPTNGLSTTWLTIVMNNNPFLSSSPGDFWTYQAGGNFTNYQYLSFTEDTNLTTIPIKYAPTPFLPTNIAPLLTNLYYQPEQSISALAGITAAGNWQMEVLDNRGGATNTTSSLVSWELAFTYASTNLFPSLLGYEKQLTVVGTNAWEWFKVPVPTNATLATNILVSSTLPVNFWLSTNALPTNSAVINTLLVANTNAGIAAPPMSTNAALPYHLVPGGFYYLGIQNTNQITNATCVVEVDFDHGNPQPFPQGGILSQPSLHFNATSSAGSGQGSSAGVKLSWTPDGSGHYEIQWKNNLTDPWQTVTNPITTTTNGVSTFVDSGEQTSPMSGKRFYRLVWLPTS